MDSPNTKLNQIMFSLQQGDDFVDQDQTCLISFQQEDLSPDFHGHVSMMNDMGKSNANRPESSTRKRAGNRTSNKPNLGSGGSVGDGEDDKTQKKMAHREIEKQRRKEMSKLYDTLRDLLPLEFVRGKRSVSDHMHQAVDYIKQMEENVKGLSMKRDELKKYSDTNESSMNQHPNTVSASFCNGGVEILINSCSIGDGFSLSGVLTTLLEEGLSVTNCILTKVNDTRRFLHSIQCEASDLSVIDLSMLQQRLVFVANTQPPFI